MKNFRTFLAATTFLALLALVARAEEQLHKVVKVVDGDTIHIRVEGEQSVKVRLHGIDTPEKGQAYYRSATKALKKMVAGENVRVIPQDVDRYGRLVGKVYLPVDDDHYQYVNLAMVEQGWAWWYEKYARYEFEFRNAQQQAQEQGLGLWQDEKPIAPWDYRRSKR